MAVSEHGWLEVFAWFAQARYPNCLTVVRGGRWTASGLLHAYSIYTHIYVQYNIPLHACLCVRLYSVMAKVAALHCGLLFLGCLVAEMRFVALRGDVWPTDSIANCYNMAVLLWQLRLFSSVSKHIISACHLKIVFCIFLLKFGTQHS